VSEPLLTIRLVLADAGVFQEETIRVPAEVVARYDRLIDFLPEDEELLKRYHLDLNRLAVAVVVED
jgi:hypothetical protein